jgi:predicted SAM-dependent methyltransferase
MFVKKLNIGCGSNWKELYPDYSGLDIVDYGQLFVTDIIHFLYEDFPHQNIYEEVMANHFLEHFDQNQLKLIFLGVHRLLKNGGLFRIAVPHKDRPEAWYLVHKTFFNEETFRMFDRVNTDSYDEFGKWSVQDLVTNSKGNIHCVLQKIGD